MDCDQEPHLLDYLRRPKNDSFGVHYCAGLCVNLAPSYLTTQYCKGATKQRQKNSIHHSNPFFQPEYYIKIHKTESQQQKIPWSSRTGQFRWYGSCTSQLHRIAPHRKVVWCDAVFRHVQAHERCWNCVGSHMIHISDCPTIHASISWGLVYSVTLSHPDQFQPIVPVPHASPRKSKPCYTTNEYYQYKRRFYSVLEISRDKYIPKYLVSSSYRPRRIPTYWIEFTPSVDYTSNRGPLKTYYVKEEIEARNVSSIGIKFHQSIEDYELQIADEENIIFNTQRFNHRLVASVWIPGKHAIAIESETREQQQQVVKLVTEQIVKDIHLDTVPEPPNSKTDVRQPQYFLSAERHSNTTPEDLSELWGISVAHAALTLKATTQKVVQ